MDEESKINPDLIDYIEDTSTLIELTAEIQKIFLNYYLYCL